MHSLAWVLVRTYEEGLREEALQQLLELDPPPKEQKLAE
jgi:hypothetical protein